MQGVCLVEGLCRGVWYYYRNILPKEDIEQFDNTCQFSLKSPYVEKYFIRKMQEEEPAIPVTSSDATKLASQIVFTCSENFIELDMPVPHPEEKEMQKKILEAGATKPTDSIHRHTFANHLHFLIYDIPTFKKITEILDVFRYKGLGGIKSYQLQKTILSALGIWFVVSWFKNRWPRATKGIID